MPNQVCLHSQCNKRLRSDNRSGWCYKHHGSTERYRSDTDYRARIVDRVNASYASNPDLRLAHNARTRYRRANEDGFRERINNGLRARYATDPDYREIAKARSRERYHRLGGKGYQRNRRALDGKQANLCAACGSRMYDDVTVDHIYPVALGGGSEISNLQAVHSRCNSRKRDRYDLFAVNGR